MDRVQTHDGGSQVDFIRNDDIAETIAHSLATHTPADGIVIRLDVFNIVRKFMAVPNSKAADFESEFLQWYENILPLGSKNWERRRANEKSLPSPPSIEEIMDWYKAAWSRVEKPFGEGDFEKLIKDFPSLPFPKAADSYEDDDKRAIVKLCAELQKWDLEHTFYLACRAAAVVMAEPKYQRANDILGVLEHDKVIKCVKRGTRGTRGKSNEYKFTGDLSPIDDDPPF